jgi:GR25 family glycosyltransferase involved in LPS biosynthesis
LEKRTDRWERVKRQFEKNNIIVERWNSVNGENIPDSFFNGLIPEDKSEKELSNLGIYENKNALACLLTHLLIIKDAKYKNYKRVLIFEDDVNIENDFKLRIKECQKLNWKLLYLGSSQFNWNNIEYTKDNKFYMANQSLGTFAYGVDMKIYDDIISLLQYKKNIKSVDNLLLEIQNIEKGECFVYNKNIVTSNNTESDIRGISKNQEFVNFDIEFKLNNKSLKFNKLSAILNLVDIRDVLENFNINYWLTDGTLLGLYRQGDFISHDMDTDIGILYETFNPIAIQKLIDRGFEVQKTYGVLENGFEISFTRNNVKTDLFFFYKNDDKLWHAAWYSEDNFNFNMIKYEYDRFEIQKREFYGYKFNTPENIEDYIIKKYGFDWKTPNANWDWKFSPKNHIKTNKSYNINEFNISKDDMIEKCNLINNVTLIIKSFKRESCLSNLILSIRKFYRFINIIIVDDSDVEINIELDNNIEFYKLEFDSGLSKGRNYAISKVKTKYFVLLDDDFEFTSNTNLEKYLLIIERSDLDILGGDVIMNGSKMEYNGLYEFDYNEKKLTYKYGFYENKIYYKTYDFILNFFIGKTSSILENRWDDDLKLAEHTAFFFDNKGKIKVGHTELISIDHQKVLEGDYIGYRKRGTMFFNSWMIKKGIEKTINLKGEEYICKKS